jgi:serine/threonine protein kinase/class 3 adenylate cyclase
MAPDTSNHPPTGTVTFLFTDIEGSTIFYEKCPDKMDAAIVRHDALLRGAIESHGGYVFKTVGDAFCAAFGSARQALLAALAAQRALFAEEWDAECTIRVRMALHTGAATERKGDYFGPPVNRVARLLSAGHGGQVLLSGATFFLVRDSLDHVEPEAELRSLGEHRLKDLRFTENVYQLAVPDLPADFPPIITYEPILPKEGEFENGESEEATSDRYRIKGSLGSGGMAEVYLAQDRELDREVAIKALRPEYASDRPFIERFKREAKSAASLSHSHIVPVYDWGETKDGAYYIVMEHCSGGTLKELIQQEGRLPPRWAAEIARQIAEALEYAHRHGLVHRDIKPQNILLTEAGEAKVADFGIARAASLTTVTQPGSVMGTAQYLSPEQAKGSPATPQSDLYSLGIVLYEMLTGRLPFESDTPVGIMIQHVETQAQPPVELNEAVPQELNRVTLKLMAKDPNGRYPSAAALARELERILRHLERVRVPDLAGLSVREARERLEAVGLSVLDRSQEHHPAVSEGRIISQSPPPGVEIEAGSPVSVGVSLGPEPVVVPDLSGLSSPEVREALEQAGLSLGREVREPAPEIPEGCVLAQDPPAGARVPPRSPVGVTLSVGPERRSGVEETILEKDRVSPIDRGEDSPGPDEASDPPGRVPVPDLGGLSVSGAEGVLASAGLSFGPVRSRPSDRVVKDTVLAQDPAPGAEVEPGSPVSVTVSSGSERSSGGRRFPGGLAAGIVAVVAVVVWLLLPSSSPVVPSFIGLSLEEAQQTAAENDLEVAVVEGGSGLNDIVLRQEPLDGASVEPGSEVRLTLGSCEPCTTIPDLTGLTADEARNTLRGKGLTLANTFEESNDEVPAGEVFSQNPPPRSLAPSNSSVSVTVSSGP